MVYHWVIYHIKKSGFSFVKTNKTPGWNTWDLFMNSPLLGYNTQVFKKKDGISCFHRTLVHGDIFLHRFWNVHVKLRFGLDYLAN
jgi:hypothetical protein